LLLEYAARHSQKECLPYARNDVLYSKRQRDSDERDILMFSRFHIYAGDGDLFNNFSIPSLGSAKFVIG
jgi:hypothetical protein